MLYLAPSTRMSPEAGAVPTTSKVLGAAPLGLKLSLQRTAASGTRWRKTVNIGSVARVRLVVEGWPVTSTEVVTPGEILRVWRQYAGRTLQEVVDDLARLHIASPDARAVKVKRPNNLSQWENGSRNPHPVMVRRLGVALGLSPDEQDALLGLWRAAGSVVALPPRIRWEHNYQPESDRKHHSAAQGGPAWVWLRCASGADKVSVSVGWGPWGEDIRLPATRSGMLASAPFSLPNPPIQVTFSQPSWADFGSGKIPQGVSDRLQIQRFVAANLAHGRLDDPPELSAVEEAEVKHGLDGMKWLGESKVNILWQQIKPRLGAMRPSKEPRPLQGATIVQTNWTEPLRTDATGDLIDQFLQTPAQIKAIRKNGRNLSAEAAAQAVNNANLVGEDDVVSSNQIENLERRGTIPTSSRIIARLDYVYGMDGYLGIERVFSSRSMKTQVNKDGQWTIRFPEFWIGPIWLQLRAPKRLSDEGGEVQLDLQWGPWRRLQMVRDATVVTTRKSTPENDVLLVRPLKGWNLIAGTGLVPGAIDINGYWYPVSLPRAAAIFMDGYRALKNSGHLE
jgi:transcriptional regulator with XRE-family HTH domain